MKVNPYLIFNGDCADAFTFYQQCLGGELNVQTHGQSALANQVSPKWHSRVLHANLKVGDTVLMGSDAPPDSPQAPGGFSVSLEVDDADGAQLIFGALGEGGSVTMPLQQTFWAERFGMVTDRFGVPWMINYGNMPPEQ